MYERVMLKSIILDSQTQLIPKIKFSDDMITSNIERVTCVITSYGIVYAIA